MSNMADSARQGKFSVFSKKKWLPTIQNYQFQYSNHLSYFVVPAAIVCMVFHQLQHFSNKAKS